MQRSDLLTRLWAQFGGAASEAQLAWLRDTLEAAAQQGQRVLVMSHLPLYPGTCQPTCLMWNFQQVQPPWGFAQAHPTPCRELGLLGSALCGVQQVQPPRGFAMASLDILP